MQKLKIKKNDKVEIIAGKDVGKQGKVIRLLPMKNRIVVQGVAKVKKNIKPTQKNPQAGTIEVEASINASNVMLLCPACGQKTRVGIRKDGEINVRFCKKCEQTIEVAK